MMFATESTCLDNRVSGRQGCALGPQHTTCAQEAVPFTYDHPYTGHPFSVQNKVSQSRGRVRPGGVCLIHLSLGICIRVLDLDSFVKLPSLQLKIPEDVRGILKTETQIQRADAGALGREWEYHAVGYRGHPLLLVFRGRTRGRIA